MAKKKQTVIPDEVKESANKIWLAGLGAVSMAEEEGTKLFKTLVKKGETLVKKGETFERQGKKRLEKVQDGIEDRVQEVRDLADSAWNKVGSSFDEKVADTLKRLGVPTRMEIQKLTKRVGELTTKVDQLKPRKTAKKTTKTTRRTRKTA